MSTAKNFEGNWPAVHGEKKGFAAVTKSIRELLWHSEHKERGESRVSELPLHTSLISWHKRSIDIVATWCHPPDLPILQEERDHFTWPVLPNDFKGEVADIVLVNTPRMKHPHSCPFNAVAAPHRASWAAIPPHVSKIRSWVTVRPKGIFLSRHVPTNQGTCFHCFSWDTRPEFDQLTKNHRLLLLYEEEKKSAPMRPILPGAFQCVVQTRAVPGIQTGPNPSQQRLFPRLSNHAWALSTTGHWRPLPQQVSGQKSSEHELSTHSKGFCSARTMPSLCLQYQCRSLGKKGMPNQRLPKAVPTFPPQCDRHWCTLFSSALSVSSSGPSLIDASGTPLRTLAFAPGWPYTVTHWPTSREQRLPTLIKFLMPSIICFFHKACCNTLDWAIAIFLLGLPTAYLTGTVNQ